jgi:hypothetical protein
MRASEERLEVKTHATDPITYLTLDTCPKFAGFREGAGFVT